MYNIGFNPHEWRVTAINPITDEETESQSFFSPDPLKERRVVLEPRSCDLYPNTHSSITSHPLNSQHGWEMMTVPSSHSDAHTSGLPFVSPLPLGWEGWQEPSYYFWLSFLRQPFMAVPRVWPMAAPQTHQASIRFMTILTTGIQSAHLCRAQTAGNMSFCKYYTGELICCGSKEQKRTLLSGPQRRKKMMYDVT